MARGLTSRRAAVTIWAVSVLFALVAIGLVLENALAVTIPLIAVTLALFVGARRLGLLDLLARVPHDEQRQLGRLRLYSRYASSRIAEDPEAIEEVLRTAAQEAGARVTVGEGSPRGDVVASDESGRWISVEFAAGTPVYREEALALLLKLAFEGRAAQRILDAHAKREPAPPRPASSDVAPTSSSDELEALRDETPPVGMKIRG
jgi:hypothetical protein